MRRIFLTAVFFAMTAPLSAWNESTHQMVARAAAKNPGLPESFRALLAKNIRSLEQGAADPDIYDDSDTRAHDVEVALERVRELRDMIMKTNPPPPKLARELGKICHYIADINNPMHTDQDDAEQDPVIQAHARYEDQAEAIKISERALKKPVYVKDIERYIEDIGERSNADFDWIISIYENPGTHISKVKDRTGTYLVRAAQDTSNLFFTVWKDLASLRRGVPAPPAPRKTPTKKR